MLRLLGGYPGGCKGMSEPAASRDAAGMANATETDVPALPSENDMASTTETVTLQTDVLVVGSGAAGMAAALAAAEASAHMILADRSLIGRSGATIMAQMMVAAALGSEGPDDWTHRLADTLTAGRGLCDAPWLASCASADAPKSGNWMPGRSVGPGTRTGASDRRR